MGPLERQLIAARRERLRRFFPPTAPRIAKPQTAPEPVGAAGERAEETIDACARAFFLNLHLIGLNQDDPAYAAARGIAAAVMAADGVAPMRIMTRLSMSRAELHAAVEEHQDVLPREPGFDIREIVAAAKTRLETERGTIVLRRPTMRAIQQAVAERFHVGLNDLLSARRTKNVVIPRMLAVALCRRLTLRSLPEIGRRTGKRDHTTILHAVKKATPALDACGLPDDAPLAEWVEALHRVTRGGVTLDIGGKDAEA